MANKIFPGRYTAQVNKDFAVFLIGMRINHFWNFRKWWPVSQAMGPMLQTLYQHPEKGFYGAENFFNLDGPTTLLLTYWDSFESIEQFARNPSDPHLEAWKTFRKAVGDDGTVGIWHETYLVRAGEHEAVYGNMPQFGLAKAFGHVPITASIQTARQRISKPEAQALQEVPSISEPTSSA
ncbi:MAG: DUF4188 domain-containing protein [Anaerolineae bacterium]|nr:DUF4188 domain-containing protein [Anaerolineae bacterium]